MHESLHHVHEKTLYMRKAKAQLHNSDQHLCFLFIELHGVVVMHQSFVYTDSQRMARLRCRAITFFIVPPVPGNYQGFNIGNLTPVRFSVV